MYNLKNYYDQQQELKLAEIRCESLKNKKEMYFQKTQPKATIIKDAVVMVEPHQDVFLEYTHKVKEIDDELDILYKEIKIYKDGINKMEDVISTMKDKHARIFLDIYINGLSVRETALKENYSESHIYTLLDEIKKMINSKK